MKFVKIIVSIETLQDLEIGCFISDKTESLSLSYFRNKGTIACAEKNNLADVIHKYKFQFDKVMRSAIKGNISVGQIINCVFIEDFNFLNNADYFRYIRMDRRAGKLKISSSKTELKAVHKIYADGSFADKTSQSGYGGFIEDPNGIREIFYESFCDGSSNLMELLAVTEGLQRLKEVEKIQVNTDSRFVIRGLIQWVHFWKLNNWQTAYGTKVKFAKHWQRIDQLCEEKVLEFNWIKGHSGNVEQDFCHQLARKSAISPDSHRDLK